MTDADYAKLRRLYDIAMGALADIGFGTFLPDNEPIDNGSDSAAKARRVWRELNAQSPIVAEREQGGRDRHE